MAATSKEKDYVHLLFKEMENMQPNNKICFRVSNLSAFERDFKSLKKNSLDSLVNFHPDIIIFQLGENVRIDDPNVPLLFQKKYTELINRFKQNGNPITICTLPFFPSSKKNDIIEKVVLATNSYLVDLSHLALLDPENCAKDEKKYDGDKSVWKAGAIGLHPGDIGMKKIAHLLFFSINASMQRKYKGLKKISTMQPDSTGKSNT